MAIETATYLDELVPANPAAADDHIRLLKTVLCRRP